MNWFALASIIITLAAVFGFINVRFLKLPNTIGLMVVAIVFTMLLFASSVFDDRILESARRLIGYVDFQEVLLEVMLGFLLFAGALHTNFDQLRVQRWPVMMFATLGVLASTFLVAGTSYFVFNALGLEVQFIHCCLFGALISPTDPIAVLGILKQAKVPKKLETKIVGESLFNDGVGVVVFLTLFSIATGGHHPNEDETAGVETVATQTVAFNLAADSASASETSDDPEEHSETTVQSIATLFGVEVFGGIGLGLVLGIATFFALRSIDDYEIEVLMTLACVMGGYSLASYFHVSAPLAVVVAGLMVGNDTIRGTAMSKMTETYVDRFWEMLDVLLNAVLFVLIGLEILILDVRPAYIYASIIAIFLVLGSRFLSLLTPVHFFAKRLDFVPRTLPIMTWGGLRGGISIALALQLTPEMNRDLFLTVTYGVVIFSIVVQGLTVGKLAKRLIGSEASASSEASVASE